jgi:hypothetical protein
MIFIIANSNKFQKIKLWKEKLVEDVATLGPIAHATLVMIMNMFVKLYFENNIFIINSELLKFQNMDLLID